MGFAQAGEGFELAAATVTAPFISDTSLVDEIRRCRGYDGGSAIGTGRKWVPALPAQFDLLQSHHAKHRVRLSSVREYLGIVAEG